MSDEVASLGFAVDSKPLDDARASLKGVATEAQNTGKAVDDLNQKTSKTGDALGKAAAPARDLASAMKEGTSAATAYAGPIGAIQAAADRSGISFQQMSQRIAEASTAHTAVSAATSATSGALSGLVNAIGAATGSMGPHVSATKALAAEHGAASAVGKEFRETIHTLGPALEQAGLKMSALTQFSGASRAGMGALAAAVGGALVFELAKSGDQAGILKTRLEGLAGVKLGDQYASELQKFSKELGTIPSAVAPAMEALVKFGQLHAFAGVFGAESDPARITQEADALGAAIRSVFEQLRLGGASTDEATKATNEFFASVTKTGTLTGEALAKLQQAAPGAAQAITNAMTGGRETTAQYIGELDKAPASIRALIDVLGRLAPASDQAFKTLRENPKTVSDAVDLLKNNFEELWKSISKGNGVNTSVTNVIKGAADLLKPPTDGGTNWIGDAMKAISDAAQQDVTDIRTFMGVLKQIQDSKFALDWDPNLNTKVKDVTVDFLAAQNAGKQFSVNGSSDMKSLGAAADAMARSVGDSLLNVVQSFLNAAGKMGSAAAGMFSNATPGTALSGNTDAMGNPTSGSVDGAGNQIASSIPNYAQQVADGTYPAFAGGGQLTVGGSGGTDSQLVQFMATPGEVIDIKTAADMAAQASSGGIQGLTKLQGGPVTNLSTSPDPATQTSIKQITDAIDQSTIDISKEVLSGSNNIVNALNTLIGGVASSTVNPATGLPVASSVGAAISGAGALTSRIGSMAAGGFNTKGGGMGAEEAKSIAQNAKDNPPLTAAQWAQYAAMGPGLGQSIRSAGFKPYKPSGSANPTMPSTGPLDRFGNKIMQRNGKNAGTIFGNDQSSPLDGMNWPYGPNGAPSQDNGYADYTSGLDLSGFGGNVPSYLQQSSSGTYGSSSYDPNGGFTPANPDLGYMPGAWSGFPDSTATTGLDSLNSSNFYDFGSYAKGGSFIAGQQTVKGTDSLTGIIHLTPGEQVDITPNSVPMPAGAGSTTQSAGYPSSPAHTITNKTVNINVQAGIQADSFIRSRAQIARGL